MGGCQSYCRFLGRYYNMWEITPTQHFSEGRCGSRGKFRIERLLIGTVPIPYICTSEGFYICMASAQHTELH